ncbi:50S ribosomal protein L5 [Candidatus Haliotispira prima]|uniref:Large ribosomal subunit protein uL5 n=1 Tax=Candidatus Haliotispira prima TaxID=3034016 RepID=A0ABY8MGD2_9SPIO|nr:50S ribosomal protein L5 [Candidatus Haliotispira prima]
MAEVRMKKIYKEEVLPELYKQFSYKSVMQVPALEKITVSIGIGEAIQNKKLLDGALSELALITGQMGVKTKARKSVAAFKVRAGMATGVKVTLRGSRMYDFYDRLVSIALPRVKDFRGISPKSFDRNGNFSLGIDEQIIFPEINYDKIEQIRGMNINIVTTAKSDEEGYALLDKMGMPFRKGA